MRQKDQNRLNMWRTVQLFLKDKESLWVSNVPFSKAVDSLGTTITDAQAAMLGQTLSSTGHSRTKEALSNEAIDRVMQIAKCTIVLAEATGNNPLRQAVGYTRTTLRATSGAARAGILRSMINAARSEATALEAYGVGAADFTASLDSIDAFVAAMIIPRATIAQRAAVTSGIRAILTAGAKAIATMDNLIRIVGAGNSEFVRGYEAARIIVNAGHRRNPPPAQAA